MGQGWFFWLTYKDFAYWTVYGCELINNIQPPLPIPNTPPIIVNPSPEPAPKPNPSIVINPNPSSSDTMVSSIFSGELRFVLANNTAMIAHLEEVKGLFINEDSNPKPQTNDTNFEPDSNFTIGKFIAYRMDKAYTEGTRFQLFLRNNEPAYVYAIAIDNTNQAVVLFPHKPNISPALNYKNNEVALPSEDKFIQMDNVRGTDVFCLLYSKEPLEIQEICRRLEKETGTFFQRLYKTMQNKLVNSSYLRYHNERIRFEVKSYGEATVMPIVVEIPHN